MERREWLLIQRCVMHPSIFFNGICTCTGLTMEENQACRWVNLASSEKATFALLYSLSLVRWWENWFLPMRLCCWYLLLTRGVQRLPNSMGVWLVSLEQLCPHTPHRLWAHTTLSLFTLWDTTVYGNSVCVWETRCRWSLSCLQSICFFILEERKADRG